MLTVALTGGLCSGKSTVAKWLAQAGCAVLDADRIGHALLEPGTEVAAAVVERFGMGIADASGQIQRHKLAALVFADEPSRRDLNRLLHPPIRAAVEAQLASWAREGKQIAVVEAALYVEEDSYRRFDRLVVVTCPSETKLARCVARNGGTRGAAEARLATQLPDAAKAAVADAVIDNSGTPEQTQRQVEALLETMRQWAAQPMTGGAR